MLFRSAVPTDSRYFPMLLTEAEGENAALSLVATWNQYKALPQGVKDILVSDEISERLKSLQDKFHIEIGSLGKISILIRKLFFGEIQLVELEARIGEIFTETGSGNPKQTKEIFEFIQKEILTIKPKPKVEEVEPEEVKPKPVTVRLPLLQALSKYENLGNQLITRERIRVKSQAEPVRPSLLYWIKYYRDELGIGHHDSVQRGNFLFRSENGKRLSAEERERVNLVLKSVEENLPIEVDTERSEIIFPFFETPISAPARAPFQPPLAPQKRESPAEAPEEKSAFGFGRGLSFSTAAAPQPEPGALSFSSKHVFPAEKSEAAPRSRTPIPPPVPAPAPIASVPPVSPAPTPEITPPPMATNPFHIRPVSLGKRDE